MLKSEKALNELKSREAKLKEEMAALAVEKNKIVEQYVKDKLQVAVVLSDKLFRELFQGKVAEMFSTLAGMVKEISATDPKAETRLNGDGYGLDGGEAQAFFTSFVFPSIVNGRGLADILEKTKKHGDNPYLKKE